MIFVSASWPTRKQEISIYGGKRVVRLAVNEVLKPASRLRWSNTQHQAQVFERSRWQVKRDCPHLLEGMLYHSDALGQVGTVFTSLRRLQVDF